MLDRSIPIKKYISLRRQIVAVGLFLFFVLFAIIFYVVSRYTGELWVTNWADIPSGLVEQIRVAAQVLVITIFVAIFPVWTLGTIIFSIRFMAPYRNLAKVADQIAEIHENGGFPLDLGMNKQPNDEIDELKGMMSSMLAQIQKRDEQFRSIVSHQQDLIHRWRPDFSFTFVNEAFCEFFGYPKEFWLTTDPVQLARGLSQNYPELLEIINTELLTTLSPDHPEVVNESYLTMPNGETHWVQWITLGLFDADGRIIECQSIGHVLTDLKRAQLEVENVNHQLTQLSHELIVSEEAGRAQLARFLHDEILGELGKIVRSPGDRSMDIAAIQQVIDQLRASIYEMRSPMLNYGLSIALDDLIDSCREMLGTHPVVEFRFEVPRSEVRFTPEVETHIYRIVQQATKNALDHAGASLIRVVGEIRYGLIDLVVEDNGRGFEISSLDEQSLAVSRHYGLIGMKERCKIIGARLEIDSAIGRGSRVRVWWQLGDTQELRFPSPAAQKFHEATANYTALPDQADRP